MNARRTLLVRRWPALLLALVASIALLGVACGADDDDAEAKAEVEAALQAAADAWNGQDVEGLLTAFTDKGLLETFDATREEAREFLPEFIGDPPAEFRLISVEVSGDTATTVTDEFFGNIGNRFENTWLNQDGAWLWDGERAVAGEAPVGATVVDLALTEFSFRFDAEEITSGNIAFDVSNIGGEMHEVALVAVAPDLDIEQAIQSEEGFEDLVEGLVGVAGPYDPGTDTTIVFTEALAPGRYAMLCFVETADGTPHAALGMINEFTIQ